MQGSREWFCAGLQEQPPALLVDCAPEQGWGWSAMPLGGERCGQRVIELREPQSPLPIPGGACWVRGGTLPLRGHGAPSPSSHPKCRQVSAAEAACSSEE